MSVTGGPPLHCITAFGKKREFQRQKGAFNMKKNSPTAAKSAVSLSGAVPAQRPAAGKVNMLLQGSTQQKSAQTEAFDAAMKLFHGRDFAAALEWFEKAVDGESREMAHTARLHARMCAQRLGRLVPELRTLDDVYQYVIGLISERKLAEAEKQLRQVIDAAPAKDFLHYSMSLVRGLQGDLEGAAKHMEQAIRLDPKNRVIARTDQDFLEFGRHSPLRELVFGEKKEPA
jgi:tetratricopeptide (TPR) repeat protein